MSEKRITVVEHARKAGRTLEQLQASEAEVTRLKGLLEEARIGLMDIAELGVGMRTVSDTNQLYFAKTKAAEILAKLPR